MDVRNVFGVFILINLTGVWGLWCFQGGKEPRPVQCPDGITECWKFECEGEDAAEFVARGCGLPGGKTAQFNDSCAQARGVCNQLEAPGFCGICKDTHICNNSLTTFIPLTVISTMSLSLLLSLIL